MRRIFLFFSLTLLLGISYLFTPNSAHAVSGDVDYSVESIVHPKQLNKQLSFFDLLVKPNDKTTLDILIHNETNQTEEFSVSYVDAHTNGNGLIVYENQNQKQSNTLSVKSFSDTLKQQIKVPAFSSKKVKIPIQVSGKYFKGSFLSGIRVEKKMSDDKKEQVGINNRYVYVLGVKLSMGLMKESFDPAWEGVSLNTKSYYPVIDFKIKNQTASISSPLKVEMILKKDKKVITRQNLNARFVPLGKASLQMHLQKELKQGKYTTYLKMYDTENRTSWKFKDQITINKKEEAIVNKHIKKEESPPSKMSLSVIIMLSVAGMIFLGLIAYVYVLRKQLSTSSRPIV